MVDRASVVVCVDVVVAVDGATDSGSGRGVGVSHVPSKPTLVRAVGPW